MDRNAKYGLAAVSNVIEDKSTEKNSIKRNLTKPLNSGIKPNKALRVKTKESSLLHSIIETMYKLLLKSLT